MTERDWLFLGQLASEIFNWLFTFFASLPRRKKVETPKDEEINV